MVRRTGRIELLVGANASGSGRRAERDLVRRACSRVLSICASVALAIFLSGPGSPVRAGRDAGAIPGFDLAQTAGAQAKVMSRQTVYKGRPIRLTAEESDGGWLGAAEFLDQPHGKVSADGAFPNADAALEAALSKAMAQVDRERESRGKP